MPHPASPLSSRLRFGQYQCACRRLTLFGYDGERTNTFGTKFDQGSFNIFNCPTGMKIIGLRLIATGNDPPYVGGFGVTCGAVPLLCDTECMLLTKEANPAYQPNYPAPEFLVEQCNDPVKGTCVGVHLKGAASKAMCVVKNSCVSALVEDGASMDCNAIGSCPLSTFTGLGTLGMCNAYYACSKAAFGKGAHAECNAAGACEEARFVDVGTHAVCTPGACVKTEFYLGASVECNGEYACGDIILNGYGTKVLCTSADACLPQPPLPVPQPKGISTLACSSPTPASGIVTRAGLQQRKIGTCLKVTFDGTLREGPLGQVVGIIVCEDFNHPLGCLPVTLRELRLSCAYDHPLRTLPPALEVLVLGNAFQQELQPHLPDKLRTFRMGERFDAPIALPAALEELRIGNSYSRALDLRRSLRRLHVWRSYPRPLPPLPHTFIFDRWFAVAD
ncbi:hypothetical protein JKP88DRAFT_265699 [Tribonema minus]|uniref:Uncharacterized protein n=1 Tax=Tribonema minus TaxID=303371 RepID=A0A835YKX3_9STRA|nr:hypothetical protein JKP88DRAFT_265699 [Tribonema minus]